MCTLLLSLISAIFVAASRLRRCTHAVQLTAANAAAPAANIVALTAAATQFNAQASIAGTRSRLASSPIRTTQRESLEAMKAGCVAAQTVERAPVTVAARKHVHQTLLPISVAVVRFVTAQTAARRAYRRVSSTSRLSPSEPTLR
jgi:hypothetical protein